MENPTDAIREAVCDELARRRMSQTELARRVGTSKQHLSKALTGGSSELPKLWKDALDVLRLELTIVPKRSASGLPYTGDPETDEVLDDVQLTERLLAHQRKFEGLSESQIRDMLEEMLDQGELVPLERVIAELAEGV